MTKKHILLFVLLALTAFGAFGQEGGAVVETTTGSNAVRWGAIAAAFVLGIAAAAGAMGQSRAIVAACEGIARNPGAAGAIRLSMIIGLALIESLVIYALLMAYLMHQL